MEQQQEETLPPVSSSYLPFQLPPGEDGGEFGGFGWAGLALDPQRPQRVATVRTFLDWGSEYGCMLCCRVCIGGIVDPALLPPILMPPNPQTKCQVRAYGKMLAWTDIEAASPTTAPLQVHRLWQPPAALAYIHTGTKK